MFCTPYPPSEPFSYYTSRPQQSHYGYRQCYSPYDAYLEEEQARIAQVKAAKRRAYEAHIRREILARQQQVSRQREQEKRERKAEAERRRAAYQRQLFNHLFGPRQQPEQEQEPADSTGEEEVDDAEEEQYVYSPFQRRNVSAPSQKRHTCVSETLHREDKQQPTASTSYIPISTPQDQERAPVVEQPKIAYEEAVAIVQKYGQRAITIRHKLRSLNKVRQAFVVHQQAFTLPKSLDYNKEKSLSSSQPVLAFTPNNRPLQAYEESLLRLLMDLDDVPSGGLERVKKARKALAKDIQTELTKLDAYKAEKWEELQETLSQSSDVTEMLDQ